MLVIVAGQERWQELIIVAVYRAILRPSVWEGQVSNRQLVLLLYYCQVKTLVRYDHLKWPHTLVT